MRYESGLADAEWVAIASLFPSPNRRGRPRKTDQGRALRAQRSRPCPSLRTVTWLGRCCRLAKDFERTVAQSGSVGEVGRMSVPDAAGCQESEQWKTPGNPLDMIYGTDS